MSCSKGSTPHVRAGKCGEGNDALLEKVGAALKKVNASARFRNNTPDMADGARPVSGAGEGKDMESPAIAQNRLWNTRECVGSDSGKSTMHNENIAGPAPVNTSETGCVVFARQHTTCAGWEVW